MRKATYNVDDKSLLDSIFSFFVSNGLENITIREICRGTGISQGTLYYWFGDKSNLICEVTEYGLKKVMDNIFEYIFFSLNDLYGFFNTFLNEIDKYKDDLRFIYQMAASHKYGEKLREIGHGINKMYDEYVYRLAQKFECSERSLQPLVYLFISAILDYVIWDEKEMTKIQLKYICALLPDEIKKLSEACE